MRNVCPNAESPCDEQTNRINTMATVMAGGLNLACLPIGTFIDKAGRRVAGITSAASLSIAFVCFGMSCMIDDGLLATVFLGSSYLAMGCCGAMLMLVCMTMSAYPTSDSLFGMRIPGSVINATIQMCFDLSAGIGGVLSFVQSTFHLNVSSIFIVYGLIAGASVFVFVREHVPAEKPSSIATDMPRSEFIQPKMLACYAALSSQMTFCYFYLGTVREQVLWVAGGDRATAEAMNASFGDVFLVALCPPTVVISHLICRRGARLAVLANVLLGTAFGALTVVPSAPAQYLTFALFAVWRTLLFVVLYHFILASFPLARFGRLAGASFFVAGAATTLVGPLLTAVVVPRLLAGSYLLPNLVLTAAVLGSGAAMVRAIPPEPPGGGAAAETESGRGGDEAPLRDRDQLVAESEPAGDDAEGGRGGGA
jgi:hypothetical protein